VKQCPTGQFCDIGTGECYTPPTCEEQEMKISLSNDQVCPKPVPFTVNVTGIPSCSKQKMLIKLDGCDSSNILLNYCFVDKTGTCARTLFIAPFIVGNHKIYACLDKNKDGDFNDSGEQVYASLDLNCNNCEPFQCRIAPKCNYCYSTGACVNNFETC